MPQIVDQIVDLEDYLEGQEQVQNNLNQSLIASQNLDVILEFNY